MSDIRPNGKRLRPIVVEREDGERYLATHADLLSGLIKQQDVEATVVRPRNDGRCHRCMEKAGKSGFCSACYNAANNQLSPKRFCVQCGTLRSRGRKAPQHYGSCMACRGKAPPPPDVVVAMRQLVASGLMLKDVAQETGWSIATVYQWTRGKYRDRPPGERRSILREPEFNRAPTPTQEEGATFRA